jgi:hypothetical protein
MSKEAQGFRVEAEGGSKRGARNHTFLPPNDFMLNVPPIYEFLLMSFFFLYPGSKVSHRIFPIFMTLLGGRLSSYYSHIYLLLSSCWNSQFWDICQ